MPYYEVSAKEGLNLKDMMQFAMKETYDNVVKTFKISPYDNKREPSVPLSPLLHSNEAVEKHRKKKCKCLRLFF